jgi:hypothetical protein
MAMNMAARNWLVGTRYPYWDATVAQRLKFWVRDAYSISAM